MRVLRNPRLHRSVLGVGLARKGIAHAGTRWSLLNFYFQKTYLLVTFLVILIGIIFGNLRIKGVRFGASGVLIAAMFAGYFYGSFRYGRVRREMASHIPRQKHPAPERGVLVTNAFQRGVIKGRGPC